MRVLLIFASCLSLASIQLAKAFDLDGFFSGMTKKEVLQKLIAQGLEPKPGLIDPNREIQAGAYNIGFCNERVSVVTKTIDFREFNVFLLSMLTNYGQPIVDFPSMDRDILRLRWTTNEGDYLLNSGVALDTGIRFHNVGEIDNRVCRK